MSGHDNASSQHGIFFQTKQFGSILRGSGPPVPQAGVVGDLYTDVQTWFLYEKRKPESADPWGNYLFAIPLAYQSTLKWFSSLLPTNDFGVDGDYCLLWSGFNNYGLQPSICGPKALGSWPESGDGPNTVLDPAYAGFSLPVGLSDEGAPLTFSNSWQLVVVGLDTEYLLSVPVSQLPNTSILERGLRSFPAIVPVVLDPLYAAENEHAI